VLNFLIIFVGQFFWKVYKNSFCKTVKEFHFSISQIPDNFFSEKFDWSMIKLIICLLLSIYLCKGSFLEELVLNKSTTSYFNPKNSRQLILSDETHFYTHDLHNVYQIDKRTFQLVNTFHFKKSSNSTGGIVCLQQYKGNLFVSGVSDDNQNLCVQYFFQKSRFRQWSHREPRIERNCWTNCFIEDKYFYSMVATKEGSEYYKWDAENGKLLSKTPKEPPMGTASNVFSSENELFYFTEIPKDLFGIRKHDLSRLPFYQLVPSFIVGGSEILNIQSRILRITKEFIYNAIVYNRREVTEVYINRIDRRDPRKQIIEPIKRFSSTLNATLTTPMDLIDEDHKKNSLFVLGICRLYRGSKVCGTKISFAWKN
jgi:hypothetical protein